MANVRVEQRNAHLAGPVRLETVPGRDGELSKATLTAISNSRRGSGESREEEPTAIQWTLWGKPAESAAAYLGTGSHVNVIGRLRNHHYKDASGHTVFGFSFTAEEIDYLDSRAESEARRARQAGQGAPAPSAAGAQKPDAAGRKAKKPGDDKQADDDVPF